MTYDQEAVMLYQNMVVERFRIWERRQCNEPPPWTDDPVLKNLKMTNMFRVLDPGSQFVFRLASHRPIDVITRLVLYRVTNLPATWYAMRATLGNFPVAADFIVRPETLTNFLRTYRDAGNRVFSGAYIIIPEPGTKNDKVEGAVRLTQHFVLEKAEAFLEATTQEQRFTVLLSTPGIGRFLAMQILTDWGYLQEKEPDPAFIIAGPGARRGALILNPDIPAENVIYEVTIGWFDHRVVRLQDRPLSVMDVQNTMCEWSKYARETARPRKKSLYKPAHPGVQPQPLLPEWW